MLKDIRKNKVFNRRALFVGAAQSFLATALVTRLSYLQILKHQEYSNQSDSNRIKPLINPAPRGIVVDRNNISLTRNESNYRLLLYFEGKKDTDALVEKLAQILSLSPEDKNIFLTKIAIKSFWQIVQTKILFLM